jgi:chromosome segregation ATPase
MSGTRRVLGIVIVTGLVTIALTGCSQKSADSQPVQEQVQQQTEQKHASVDEALNSTQAKVKELASAAGDLEARVNGLQVNSDLQELQRKLTSAIGEAGDKKKAALDELSSAFSSLIERVDAAAGKFPQGGLVQAKLADFSAKLKDAQASVSAAAASYEASSTP